MTIDNRLNSSRRLGVMTLLPVALVVAASCALSPMRSALAETDCSDSLPVYAIQGEGHISPYVGKEVTTCGVVTAVGFDFYYIQDPDGDDNDATSDGLYVFERGDKPSVGTLVKLTDTVTEFIPGGASTGNLSITQMSFPDLDIVQTDAELPSAVRLGNTGRTPPAEIVISEDELPVNLQDGDEDQSNTFDPEQDAIDFYESLEGMLVTVPDAVAVSATRQFGRFSAELFTLADNGAGALPVDARSSAGGILLQPHPDNRGDQNPERIQIQFDSTVYGSGDYPYVRVGDSLGDVTGVVGYSFGNFEVLANAPVNVTSGGNEPEIVAATHKKELALASYNVLNLSAVEDDDAQRDKIASQIVFNLQSPDIIALQEIQDNNGDIGNCDDDPAPCSGVLDASETLQALADAIVAAGGPEYLWFTVDPLVETTDDNRDDPDAFGGAALSNIRNAFLYLPDRVRLIDYVGLTRDELALRGVDANTAFDTSRDPLQATFRFRGKLITIINNHFSSRFGSTPIFGGLQPFVQAGENAREAQSLAMHQLVSHYLNDRAMQNIVVLGDLNTFEFTDDLAEIMTSASGDVVLSRIGDRDSTSDEYSFIFDGNSQALDHVFVSPALTRNAELHYVHVNVDFPRRFADVVASDHEPVLAWISFKKKNY